MNDHELEAYLLASRPHSDTYSPFTRSVIDTIRSSQYGPLGNKPAWWQAVHTFIWQSTLRKVTVLALLILTASFVGLSGYAYANDTNPFSLIKRWIVGEQVTVMYQDSQTNEQRQFSHGAKRNYSDMAISAFAEVSLIGQLHFHATNAYTVPKDGIEYIGDPFRVGFLAPRIGTIERVDQDTVTIHLTYSIGQSKMEQSRDIDERITIPRTSFYYYQAGKPVPIQQSTVGKLVEVFQDKYLRHEQQTGTRPTPVDLYSVFALSHSYEAIKEATATDGSVKSTNDTELAQSVSQHDIFELGAGAWSKVCSGNGADSCPHALRDDTGHNFFAANVVPSSLAGSSPQNPDVRAFGEGVATPTDATRQYKLRDIEGRIATISDDRITIKTKSGALWTFQYSVERQRAFAKAYGDPLAVGQLLAGAVLASVYDWDRRDFDNQHVYGMSRYE